MEEVGFDEYMHEACELFDDFISQTDSAIFAATTLVKLRNDVENAWLGGEESTDEKILSNCFRNVIYENSSYYLSKYKSKSKINGELSEDFISKHLRCVYCESQLSKERQGTKCLDHICMGCGKRYQTKGVTKSLNAFKKHIREGQFRTNGSAYKTRLNSVRNRECDFICVFYTTKDGITDSLTGILHGPAYKITEDNVIPCRPLKETARRAGWQGCNLLMSSFTVVHSE